MKKREREKKRWKAVYTIETALLMGVLLPILAGILWLCILLYEKGVLQGAVSQSVLLENMKEEKAETGTKAPEKNSLGRAKLYFELTRTCLLYTSSSSPFLRSADRLREGLM